MFSLRFAAASKVLFLTFRLLVELDIFECIFLLTVITSTYSTTFRSDKDNSR